MRVDNIPNRSRAPNRHTKVDESKEDDGADPGVLHVCGDAPSEEPHACEDGVEGDEDEAEFGLENT